MKEVAKEQDIIRCGVIRFCHSLIPTMKPQD